MVRLLADENIPKSVVNWLREQGHDIVRAQDMGLSGADDHDVAVWAKEEGRMILTLDNDFTRLVRQVQTPVGIMLVSTRPSTPDRINHLLSVMLSKIRIDKHTEELIVVTDNAIRIGTH